MSVLKRVLIILILSVFCFWLAGCMQSETEEVAVADAEILKESVATDEEKSSSVPIDKEETKQSNEEETEQSTEEESAAPIDKEEPKQSEEETEQAVEEEPAAVEKLYIGVHNTNALYNKEQLLEKGDLIMKVRLDSKSAEEMVNPDGKAKDASGNLINNRLVTSYNAEVLEVYKGEYSEPFITVKTSEGYGLSADLILYGEDEKFILDSPLRRFTLEIGKEYLLVLVSVKGENKVASGYFIFGPEIGCFSLNDNDEWVNTKVTTDVVFNDKTVKSEIDLLMSEELTLIE